MPRFVILHHEFSLEHTRSSHWDLMIEQDEKLLTWALDACPIVGETSSADRLADHRIDYLTYEGPVSDDRGKVHRIEAGECKIISSNSETFIAHIFSPGLNCLLRITLDPQSGKSTASFESVGKS